MNSTFAYNDLDFIRNRTFDEIGVGERASIQRTLRCGVALVGARRSAQRPLIAVTATAQAPCITA